MHHSSRNGTTQTAAAGSSSAAVTNAFGAQTYQVRLSANTACHYALGASPTASVADPFLPANIVEYVTVAPGQKIAAIQAATGGLVTQTAGTLWVTEVS